MYATRTTQVIVGFFAMLGIAALAYLSLSLGSVELLPTPGYTLYADFDNIAGLKIGDQVEVAGVNVGKVASISLRDYRARIAMRINKGVAVDKDAIAGIKTSGIIGDKYISIALGPSDETLKNGDTIRQTQSAFVLEDAIGQLINSSGSSGGSAAAGGGGKSGANSEVNHPPSAGATGTDGAGANKR
jgi:phospholipid/cholesterol/gamma-HCH transport system substrate-binding protein